MTNDIRLIDANALKERAKIMLKIIGEDNLSDYEQGKKYAFETAIDFIDNAPTVEPEKAKEGELVKAYTKGFDAGVETARPQGESIRIADGLKKARHGNYVIYDVDFLLDNLAREVNIMEGARRGGTT